MVEATYPTAGQYDQPSRHSHWLGNINLTMARMVGWFNAIP
jgi:hypothetical protein